jgi:hypothetical protein
MSRDQIAALLGAALREQARNIPASEPGRAEAYRQLMEIADGVDGGESPSAEIIPFPARPRRARDNQQGAAS